MLYEAALTLLLVLWGAGGARARYLGRELGALSRLHHGVRGDVYAVDSRTLYLHDFHYDGEGPAAYFYVGATKSPGGAGALRLRDERGGAGPLRRYRAEGLTLSLPDGKTLRDIAWLSVWCDEYSVNFGSVSIPSDLEYPKPAKLSALRGVHGVRSEPVVVVDAQTLLIPSFSYDGEAPDAKFWVGRGETPSPQGIRIPDENGKETPLRKYDRKTIVLTLPGELTVFDIGHFAVWCEAFTVNFGHIALPRQQLANVPPSLKMLGVSPQTRSKAAAGGAPTPAPPAQTRRPIARLDATTYRPPRLGAGPLVALLQQRDESRSQHRRAHGYSPSPDPETHNYKNQHDPNAAKATNAANGQQSADRHDDHFGQKHREKQRADGANHQNQNGDQQLGNYYRFLNNQNHELTSQRESYEQRLRAHEQELLREQHRRLQQLQLEPQRFRLLPYGERGGRRERPDSPAVTIQRSIDLGPAAGPPAQ